MITLKKDEDCYTDINGNYRINYDYELYETDSKTWIGQCVVQQNCNILRYTSFNDDNSNDRTYNALELHCVEIFEPYQKKGYGTYMLKKIIEEYREHELPLVLRVFKDNIVALRLYERLGFKIIGEETSSAIPAWTMQYMK